MNMLYEGLKENATIVIVPSSVVETKQLGNMVGLTALTMGIGQDKDKQNDKASADAVERDEIGSPLLST